MRPHAEQQIQSRKLYIDDFDQLALDSHNLLSSDSFYAKNLLMVDDVVPIKDPTPIHIYNMDRDIPKKEQLAQTASKLEDQIAMESVKQHLKKITQLPSGLKDSVEYHLIKKLTTIQPKRKSKTFVGE